MFYDQSGKELQVYDYSSDESVREFCSCSFNPRYTLATQTPTLSVTSPKKYMWDTPPGRGIRKPSTRLESYHNRSQDKSYS